MTNETDGTTALNLAVAREILLIEEQKLMPKGAKAQRAETLKTLETAIEQTLAGAKPPALADDAHALCKKAHAYISTLPKTPAIEAHGTPYQSLCAVFRETSNLGLASQVISWIESTHALDEIPPELVEDANASISIFCQRLLLHPEVKNWVKAMHDDKTLDADQQCNAKLMDEAWVMSAGLSEDFVNELSRKNSLSFRIWEKAKPKNDFDGWLPAFTDVVDCARRKATILGNGLKVSPYQALLEQYNAGLKNETVNTMFTALHDKLPGLVKTIMARQAAAKQPLPLPVIKTETQRKIMQRIIDALGFEPDFSRIDESMHPFSTGEWDDVRVTTHYHEDNLLSAVMSVVHEMGHLFYSRNLPREWKHLNIGTAQSMWIHESQSLFWEKQIGCSIEFVEFIADIIREETCDDSPALSAANLYRLITQVEPGFIRIEADEVTYPAHVILRHDIEQRIIAGSLAPADLPRVWAEQMQELLNVNVPDHAHGCMQDVHWTDGSFGYFPAYTFGALAAAQFMEAARTVMPEITTMVRKGQFAPIQAWLKQEIHSQGSRYDGEALMQRVTGKPLSIDAWLAHINRRYLAA